jgi:hypothetical protein
LYTPDVDQLFGVISLYRYTDVCMQQMYAVDEQLFGH